MRLVLGVCALNGLLLAVGYCLLAASLRGRSASCWLSYAGVALLAGAGSVGTGMFIAYMLGAPNGPVALGAACGVAATAGLAAARVPRWREWISVPRSCTRHTVSRSVAAFEALVFAAVATIALVALVGGFRSSPWLDDVWGIWVPKGIALDRLGLDPRLFAPNGVFEAFGTLHYPLWWSSLTGLDLRFAGNRDLRAVNAQDTLLALGFLAAAARLLWGHARPWVLGSSLLLLAASPELFRHAQGGISDLPLAIYLSLMALAAIGWISRGSGFHLALAFVFGAAAVQIKFEGLPQLLVIGVALLLLAWRLAPRRLPALLGALSVAAATAIPWLLWRAAHGVPDHVELSQALSSSNLLDQSDRIASSAQALARHLVEPSEWLLIVPAVLVLGVLGAVRERRALWLAPWLFVGSLFLFWVVVYWAAPDRLGYLLATSSYRVVDATVLIAWCAVPLIADRLLSKGVLPEGLSSRIRTWSERARAPALD